MMRRRLSWFAFLAAMGFVLAAMGCTKEEAQKPAQPKVEKKEAPKAEAKKEAPPVEAQKEPAKEPVKEPEKKEPPPPTAAEELGKARAAFGEYKLDTGAVEGFLTALKSIEEKFPGTPEALDATKAGLKVRGDFVLLGLEGERPDLVGRMLLADGKIGPGKAPGDEEVGLYCKELAARFEELAAKTGDATDAAALKARAALLGYVGSERLEAAGKEESTVLELPANWKKPMAQEGALVAPEPKPGESLPQVLPEVKRAGVDPSVLLGLASSGSPVVVEARYVVLGRMRQALQGGASADFLARWVGVAQGMDRLLCAACARLDGVKPQFIDDVLMLPGNLGVVCPEAVGAIQGGTPVADAIKGNCLNYFGLSVQDANLVEPLNLLVLRFLKLTGEMLAGVPDEAKTSPLFDEYSAVSKEVAGAIPSLVGLTPPVELFPAEKWEEMKDRLVLQSDLRPESPSFGYQPFEMFVADEKGVSQALRPMVEMQNGTASFADRGKDLSYPGQLIATVEQIDKEIADKHAALKEQKAAYDEGLGAYLQDVTIRGTLFKKPDFSIPSVVAAAKTLSETAGSFEERVFPYLMTASVLNHQRPAWPEFVDTVGKAALYVVDRETPALLFKRILDSLYYADYKDDRLIKGSGHLGSVPTVYFTEKFVNPEVLDMTYKRPILALVTESGTVRFYPPTDSTRKGKMTPNRHPRRRDVAWSKKYATVEDPRTPDPLWNLFMAHTRAGSKDFESDVQGIAFEMKKKWDNGNVIYVVADDKAQSGLVVKVAELLSRTPSDTPLDKLDKAFPGYSCDPQTAPELCPTNVVVLFPDVEIPYLPGKKKVEEVGVSVYCDEKDIAAKINAKRGAIKFCYDPELQKNPGLQGKVVFKFTIGEAGRITDISTEQDKLGNEAVLKCTQGIIKSITFRRPIGGECVIRYPWVFKP